jgi:hypothetical protein
LNLGLIVTATSPPRLDLFDINAINAICGVSSRKEEETHKFIVLGINFNPTAIEPK